jgi:sulfite oxidase
MLQFEKDAELRVLQEHPANAGPPLDRLARAFITPRELFYVRNHGTLPIVRAEEWALTVTGLVRTPLQLSLDDLRRRFPRRTTAATLECAGNRRGELAGVAPIPGELLWGAEAIGNAVWEGVALAEVLAAAGVSAEARHVAFTGLDEIEKEGWTFGFGGSISLEKAQAPEVLLAYAMNGAPLAPIHGFPLRALVPGYIGARSVKWLANIHVQAEPSDNYYQRQAYKLFPPDVNAGTADWSRGTMLYDAPLSSVICEPAEGALVEGERIVVRGYAYVGGGEIARVEVSCDGQEPWVRASLAPEQGEWTWRLWEAELPVRAGMRQIVARAWDVDGNGQPENPGALWNFKGYLNNAWHRVAIRRDDTSR